MNGVSRLTHFLENLKSEVSKESEFEERILLFFEWRVDFGLVDFTASTREARDLFRTLGADSDAEVLKLQDLCCSAFKLTRQFRRQVLTCLRLVERAEGEELSARENFLGWVNRSTVVDVEMVRAHLQEVGRLIDAALPNFKKNRDSLSEYCDASAIRDARTYKTS